MRLYHVKCTFIVILCVAGMLLTPVIAMAQEQENDLLTPFELTIIKDDNYPVAMKDVLKIAVENNLPLQIQEEQETIDKYDIYVNYSELLPDISFSYDQSRFQGGVQIFGNVPFQIYRSQVEPRMGLGYSINGGGETIFKILAAKRKLKATKYSISSTHNKLLRDVGQTYYDLIDAIKFLEIAEREIEESEAVLNLNQQRLESGLGTLLDVSQSEEQLALSKRRLIQAHQRILIIKQDLNNILNLPLKVNLIPTDADIEKKPLIQETDMEMLVASAFKNRADLKVLEARRSIYKAQRGIALSKFFPDVTFNTYWGAQGPRFSSLNEQRFVGYGVKLTFLKNLGVNYLFNYKKSGPMLRQSAMEIENKLREIETEVAKSLLEVQSADKQITVAKTGLLAAQDSFKFSSERLAAGVGTNIDVLSSQVRLTTARQNLLSSIVDYNKAQVNLLYAIGKIAIDTLSGEEPVRILEESEQE
jgi:outer membrane protein TolC